MAGLCELPDVELALVVMEYRRPVPEPVQVVWRREYRDERREPRGLLGLVHLEALLQRLVGAHHREQLVALQEVADGVVGEGVRAVPPGVVGEEVPCPWDEGLAGVGPQGVAHGTEGGRLTEPVDLIIITDLKILI